MIRRLFLIAALCFAASAQAALTSAQLVTLKAAIAAETDPTFVGYRQNGQTGLMASFFNGASTFVVWKTSVRTMEVGQAMNSTELAGLTTADTNRLQVYAMYSGGFFNPSRSDTRAGFDAIFSGSGGATTRASLLALWKRFATRAEKLFATGTGSDASPGLLVFEGLITDTDVNQALAS